MAGMEQEFTHVATTPEENGYVEAYHDILRKELIDDDPVFFELT